MTKNFNFIRNIIFSVLTLSVATPVAMAAPIDTLTIATAAEFETLNPLIAQQASTKYMLYFAYRPLITLTPDLKWFPQAIKEFPTLENKLVKKIGEGLDITIDIQDNLQWGDGTPVTCKDIEFAWKVGLSKNVSVASREAYENLSAVAWDKATSKKCTFKMIKAKFDYFNQLIDPLPEHLEGPVFEKNKGQAEGYDRNTLYVKNPTNPGLYYGPYVITDVKYGSHVSFAPNPKWLGKKPYFQKIIYKLIPNNATMEANLRSGNISAIGPAGGLGVDQAAVFERKVKSENLPYEVMFEDGVTYAHIDLNLDNPILSDLKVRQAISMSFNKKEMIDAFLEGKARPAIHNVTERDPWYTDKVKIYTYNKRQAMKLLDEAGWKVGAGKIREKNGKKMALTIMASAGAKVNDLIEAYLQDKFKDIGIELAIKNEPARVFFGETITHRKYDMALYSWVSIPEQSPRSTTHSKEIPSAQNSWAGQNSGGYKNPEVDKLIDTLESELDAKKRAELGKKFLEIYARDIPVIPVYFRQANSVMPKGIKGYRLSGHLFYESLNVEDWHM